MFFFFNDTATTEIYTLSLHDALPICHISKAGRLVSLADCLVVIVLVDNATFLLAVNRIAAFR